MRTCLLALSWLLLGPPAVAAPMVWTGKRVPVYDHSASEWRTFAQELIAEYNGILPHTAPHFIYRSASPADCADVRRKRGITICMSAALEDPNALAEVETGESNGVLRWKRIYLHATRSPERRGMCHELAHAILDSEDKWTVEDGVVVYPHPDASCVWGILESPGKMDRAFAQRVYGQRSDPHTRHGGKKRHR